MDIDLNSIVFDAIPEKDSKPISNVPTGFYAIPRIRRNFSCKQERMEFIIQKHGGISGIKEKDRMYRSSYKNKWSNRLRRFYLGLSNTEFTQYVLNS